MATLTHTHTYTFEDLRDAVSNQLNAWTSNNTPLFKTDVGKDLLWETYLNAWPAEERQEHNCNTCRQFIKACGDLVKIDEDLSVSTIWNSAIHQLQYSPQRNVAIAMQHIVLMANVSRPFYTSERKYGNHHNLAQQPNGSVITWNHFWMELKASQRPIYLVNSVGAANGTAEAKYQVFRRSLEEITPDAAQTVLELIQQKSLYRGEEYRGTVEKFITLQSEYLTLGGEATKNRWLWYRIATNNFSTIRNTVIGTLLTDISTGIELDKAVFSFENKMDPTRFNRPRAVYTESSLNAAKKTLEDLGLLESLRRRYATSQDLTVNNVLYVNRAKSAGDIFSELAAEAPVSVRTFSKVQEVPLHEFLSNVLPSSNKVELYLEDRLCNNLMTLVAPANMDAPTFIRWDNGLTWSYVGAVADSIVERVKRAGGDTEGVLCCSLAWENLDDLDLSLTHNSKSYSGTIYYGNKKAFGGELDVDMNVNLPVRGAVENIIFKDELKDGDYTVEVNNYRKRHNEYQGFTFRMQYKSEVCEWHSNHNDVYSHRICAFTIKNGELTFTQNPPSGQGGKVASKKVWGLQTNTFHNVHTLTRSPNVWSNPVVGNLHYFFLLDGVEPEEAARPFLNEFIKPDLLQQHRRVFEVLGGRITVEGKPELSGLGFSSTKSDHFYCRVTGAFSRVVKVII